MLQSQLFTKTIKETPKDETSINAQLLIRAGFIYKEMAGVYTFLPLGLRVIEKIKQIIREELNAVGALEMKMTTLQQKENWVGTGRWSDEVVDDWFKTKLKNGTELGLAFTHEEALTNIMKNFVSSYKDLPIYAYQFQTKFRNELRAKSGLLRGREFTMKDLYDFSLDKKQHEEFYEKMKAVYKKIFNKIGIGDRTYLTISNGGSFSKYSFEFQTLCDAGEDILVFDKEKNIAINKDDFNDEVFKDFDINKNDYNFIEKKSAEVGDIYNLGDKYSKALGLTYNDKDRKKKPVFMGSYGIGVPRIMAVVAEIYNDKNGLIWPEAIAPFKVHLIRVEGKEEKIKSEADKLYKDLQKNGIEVLYDDRDTNPGAKFADSDLIGIPYRIIISERSLKSGGAELKKRDNKESEIMDIKEITKKFV